jgi:acetolactate synthase I/II/III large subunit
MTTVAEVVAEHLEAAGVRFAFGMPGGETVEVLEALRQRGIRFELAHDEGSADFMADAVARVTGKPALVLTTLGPGATNAVAGVAHAYLDRSPVIILTAQKPDHLLPDYTHQVLDLHTLFTPITKRSIKVTAANVDTAVAEAIALATMGRPGPVHLQLSNEEAGLEAVGSDGGLGIGERAETLVTTPYFPAALPLFEARRPVIVAGVGLEPEGPYDALRELAETANAPVIVTPKAKGALPDDHPLSAGTIGLTRVDPVYEILEEADCILAVGFDVVELVKEWQHPAPLIWVAPWANEDPVLPAAAELVGPLEPILRQLCDADFQTAPEWGAQRVEAFRRKLAARPLPAAAQGRLLPQSVLESMRRHAGRDTLLAVDVGSHKIFSSLEWPTLEPNRFLVSNGLSCMGFALPSAIAASLAMDNAPTLCLIGDGGLAMCMGELGVLSRLNLPVTVVVMVDGAIDLIRSAQLRNRRTVHGTEFPPPDFSAIAAAYGIHAQRVGDIESCNHALQTALTSGRPTLIEAMIDPVGYPTTPRA